MVALRGAFSRRQIEWRLRNWYLFAAENIETKEFELVGGLRVEIDATKMDWFATGSEPSFAGVGVDVKDLRDDEVEIDGEETIAAWAFVPFGVPAIDGESLPFTIDDDLGLDEGDNVAAYVRVAGYDSETAGRLVKVGEGSVEDGAIAFDGGLTWITWLYITKR